MNEKIIRIKQRLKLKKQLLEEGYSDEEVKEALDRRFSDSIENRKEEVEPISDFKDNFIKLVWCHVCRKKVIPIDYVLTRKAIKKGSFRLFLVGKCSICHKKISSIVKTLKISSANSPGKKNQ